MIPSLRNALAATVAAVAISVATSAVAAEEGLDALDRADIEASYSEINGMITDMQGALASAETALGDVKTMKVEDGNRTVNEFFKHMKDRVDVMLERLGPNSVLMDNLEGAKANVIVFRRWYERQPADFPKRDQQIMRLEQTLEDYDILADQIVKGRQDARKALTDLARAEFLQSLELKVQMVEQSVTYAKEVLASLERLGAGIQKVAEQEVPEAIPE